jgi:tetratricopeptide (TPR) repeat protein
MELYYNPERMSEIEVRETFVANEWLVEEILSILKQQPKGAGVQHALIIAPRGMGKTTVLLMLRFSILRGELAQSWQPVLFPEESYAVYDLADFWLSGLNHLATETNDEELDERVSKLQGTHRDSSELEEAALATIKDWRAEHNKQLLMLVDSVDIILDQIANERDHARLRDVLMNHGTMMLVGGATSFFKEARDYDQPLYNLFKTYDLRSLNSDQINELLRRRAKLDGIDNFEDQLKRNASRLRVLEYFTGGNPRLVMMLYRVITRSEVSEVKRGLEKLLDEVTPYYKAKIESLPAQQRKILDHIARISARTREGLTPTEIAASVRLGVNQVSAQLKRLADIGYVRAANIRGRSSYYTLSEPLYAIWHQMRFGREAGERMNWLVTFLKGWYDADEITTESVRLQTRFQEYLTAGRLTEARDVLEYRRYLLGALDNDSDRARTSESIILSYLELKDVDTLKRELLNEINTTDLTHDTQLRLLAAGLLTRDQIKSLPTGDSEKDARLAESDLKIEVGQAALNNGDVDEALTNFRRALELAPDSLAAIGGVTLIQMLMDDLPGVRQTLQKAESQVDSSTLPGLKAFRCAIEGDLHGATAHLSKLDRETAVWGWTVVGTVLKMNSHLEQAIIAFSRFSELNPENYDGWYQQAETLLALDRYEEALERVGHALRIDPDSANAHRLRGIALAKLGKPADAFVSFDRAVELGPDVAETWMMHGVSLVGAGKREEALTSFQRACEVASNNYGALLLKAWILWKLRRNNDAVKAADAVLKVNPNSFDAHYIRGFSLALSGKNAPSLKAFEQAFKNDVDGSLLWNSQAASIKFLISLSAENLATAEHDWQVVRTFAETGHEEEAVWLKVASNALRYAAQEGHWDFVRGLITTSDLEEELFPLARALDYLTTGDETLIEKLSPEVRKIVEEIVQSLKKSAPKNSREKKKAQKSRRGKT